MRNNSVQGVRPATPSETDFTGSDIVIDGDTADPALATSNVEIAYNQVVGCVSTGIALAMGLDQIAHDNTVVSGIFFNAGLPHTQYERSQRSSPQGPPLCRSVDNAWHGSKPTVCGAAFLGIRPSPEQAEKLLEYPAGDTNEFGGHQRIIDRAADT